MALIQGDTELLNKFVDEYGVMDRETLVQYIEDNDLEDELKRRVEEKWDALEKNILVKRKKKGL